jgi:hypothetical protein
MTEGEPRDGYHSDNFPDSHTQRLESTLAHARADVARQLETNFPQLLSDLRSFIVRVTESAANSQQIDSSTFQIFESYYQLIRKYVGRAQILADMNPSAETHRLLTLFKQISQRMHLVEGFLKRPKLDTDKAKQIRVLLSTVFTYFEPLTHDPTQSANAMSMTELTILNRDLFELTRNTDTTVDLNYDTSFDIAAHVQSEIDTVYAPYRTRWIEQERTRIQNDDNLLTNLAVKISKCTELNAQVDTDTLALLSAHEQYYFNLDLDRRKNTRPLGNSGVYFNYVAYIEFCLHCYSSLHSTAKAMNDELIKDPEHADNSEYADMFTNTANEIRTRNNIYLKHINSTANIVPHDELTGADSLAVQTHIDTIRKTLDNPSLN